MAADGGADAVYQNLAVKVREGGLNLVRNVARIVHAGGLGNIALAGIIKPVFGMLCHLVNYCVEHLFLAADFIARDKAAQVIHVKHMFITVPNQPAALDMRPPLT